MAKILFYDLETTGTMYWKNGIHQLSGIVDIDGKEVESFDIKMQPNPKAVIDDKALATAGVSREQIESYGMGMIQGYNTLISILSKYVSKFDKSDKFHLCGFNNRGFDDPFLRAFFTQCGDNYFGSWFWANSLDVIVLASQHFLSNRAQLIDFKLSTVAEKLNIELSHEKLHDALYDVTITRECYYKLCPVL